MKQKITNFCLSIFLCLSLSGCLTAAIASAIGGGSYFIGKSANSRDEKRIKTESLIKVKEEMEMKQKSLSAKDNGITNEINQRLVSGSVAPNMAVYSEVRNGVVILHGRVPDSRTAERIIGTVRSTPGVSRIISNLVIANQQQVLSPQMMRANPAAMQQRMPQYPAMQQQRQVAPYQVQPAPPQQNQYNRYAPPQSQYISPQSYNGVNGNLGNTAGNYASGAKKKSSGSNVIGKVPASDISFQAPSVPKVMSAEELQKYQGMDNDDGYVKYNPTHIIKNVSAPSATEQVQWPSIPLANPYIVDTPSYYQDNDYYYMPPQGAGSSGNIADPYQDNDSTYELMHFY